MWQGSDIQQTIARTVRVTLVISNGSSEEASKIQNKPEGRGWESLQLEELTAKKFTVRGEDNIPILRWKKYDTVGRIIPAPFGSTWFTT